MLTMISLRVQIDDFWNSIPINVLYKEKYYSITVIEHAQPALSIFDS